MTFRTGPTNLLTDVAGLRVGNSSDAKLKSGVTAILCDEPAVAAVQVLGGRHVQIALNGRHQFGGQVVGRELHRVGGRGNRW